jgi:tetratricopeptide (TPR) repeat protein
VYANYASDFQTGEKEARAVRQPDVYPLLALAFAQIGQGHLPEAVGTYQQLSNVNALGASFATSGLADLALYEGRFSEAVRILEVGALDDLSAKSPDRAARKFVSIAYVQSLRRQKTAVIAAVEKALAISKTVQTRFLAARMFVELGELPKARGLISGLAAERQVEPRAYAKIVEGEAALKDGNARNAVNAMIEANKLLDTWIGRFELGRAYFTAGEFLQADSEFDSCLKRRGEALSLFLDEWATYGYLPPVYYYQGRVREELKTERFADSYRQYLAIRGKSTEDPLLAEVRRRAGA